MSRASSGRGGNGLVVDGGCVVRLALMPMLGRFCYARACESLALGLDVQLQVAVLMQPLEVETDIEVDAVEGIARVVKSERGRVVVVWSEEKKRG